MTVTFNIHIFQNFYLLFFAYWKSDKVFFFITAMKQNQMSIINLWKSTCNTGIFNISLHIIALKLENNQFQSGTDQCANVILCA